MNTVVVRKDAQPPGIGRSLIEAALQWARQREVTGVEISVYAFNEEALRAYRAAGLTMSVGRLMLRLSPANCGAFRRPRACAPPPPASMP